MSNCYICGCDKNSHINGKCPPASASACSAVDGGTSGCVAPAEVRSVAAGRHVTDLASMSWFELTRLQEDVTNEVLCRVKKMQE